MGHLHSNKEAVYRALASRLNKNPVGVPVNDTLMEILYRLYTEAEAMVAGSFPMAPVPLGKLARITGMRGPELKNLLDSMADKGLVLDLHRKGKTFYILAPMVVGFFEYTFMRVREEVNMKELAGLFEAYFKSEGVREEFFGSETKMFRSLAYESVLPTVVETEVLTYEKASKIIQESGGGALSMCSCRHKMSHLGKACSAPIDDICMSFGGAAQWLISRGMGKPAGVDQLLRLLEHTEKLGLVHLGDNVLQQPAYICNCCRCCCGVLSTINETGLNSVQPSNFIPRLQPVECNSCGACEGSCHINAISMHNSKVVGERPVIKEEICIGCGICAATCPTGALVMACRPVIHVPPKTKQEQLSRMAAERGKNS